MGCLRSRRGLPNLGRTCFHSPPFRASNPDVEEETIKIHTHLAHDIGNNSFALAKRPPQRSKHVGNLIGRWVLLDPARIDVIERLFKYFHARAR